MRKLLAFLVLLMLPWVARGQALADWYYWFDYDTSPRESGEVVGQQFQLQPDVSHLTTGVHTLYVQVVDTAGVYSTPVGMLFFKVPEENTIDKLFYTVDMEEKPTVLDFGNGSFALDVSKYQAGFHQITLQVMDKQKGISDVMPYLFYRVPQNSQLSEFRYWFDCDATVHSTPYGQGHYMIDVTHLASGFHVVNYYVADGEDNMTKIDNAGFFRLPVASNQKLHYWFSGDTVTTHVPNFQDGFIVDVTRLQEGFNTIYFQLEDNGPTDIMSEHFIKIPQTENAGDLTLICIIDGKIVGEEKVSVHGGVMKCDMDVSNMEVGLHKAMFQLITTSGAGSSIAETYFIRTLTNDDIASMQCSYTIDGFRHHVNKGTSTNGVFHFDLPVEDVEDGLHRIDYLLVSENGVSTTQGSAWFYKTPVGGNAITQYDYWLNDKSDEVQSVTLENPVDPFQLVKLLPVTSEPIRTSCFHFEVKDGKPMMYAKNDIHFRFHDKSGRWVDENKQFVDVNVSEPVTGINDLQPTQTFARPEDNHIAWFMFEAAAGDTVSFKASQATTLQVFAPSGKEVYTAEGKTSVAWGKTWTQERGTHYVAVHDVTGSNANITLDYDHIRIPVFPSCSGDMDGFLAASGSQFVADSVVTMPYRIEFENDATLATASALTAVIKDTLDAKVFNLASYQPTSIKIGDKDVQLKGDKEFVTTVDMRPAINAIAQVEGLYDAKKGIATWMFTSLDPMTMEPTDDIMQGFLPVNYDGRGIGEVAFNINRKPGLPDGTEIANKASIVFDSNDPILTPVWTNIVDAEPPTSRVCDLEVVSDTIVRVNFESKDYRSGVWKYALYVQYGKGTSWNQVAETDTACFDFRYYEDIDYGFCVLATDSAGNVEPKIIEREYMFVNGEATMIDAIAAPQEKKAVTNKAYDLSGRLIQEEGYRGIVIRNRRKLLKR